jgi:hypothetical protein
VVVTINQTVVRVMEWIHRTGKWHTPMWVARDALRAAPPTATETLAATESVRKHRGVIPCGGANTRYVRVKP